jgi:hypothetical protein
MRILAFDPGKNVGNFAFSLLENGVVRFFGTVIPISTMKPPEFSVDADEFFDRMRSIVASIGLTGDDIVCAERFMDRGGGGKGTTGEHINVMLGLMKAAIYPMPLELVMPATWKGWLARTYLTGKPSERQRTVVPNMWIHLRTRFPDVCWPKNKPERMTIHEADACGIALWRYEKADPENYGSITRLIDPEAVKIVI